MVNIKKVGGRGDCVLFAVSNPLLQRVAMGTTANILFLVHKWSSCVTSCEVAPVIPCAYTCHAVGECHDESCSTSLCLNPWGWLSPPPKTVPSVVAKNEPRMGTNVRDSHESLNMYYIT